MAPSASTCSRCWWLPTEPSPPSDAMSARLRPNILIGGVRGLDEVDWPGAELHIGDAIVRLDSLRARCPMTTVDPDTLDRDPEVLRDIGRRFGGRLALNADVKRGGTIRVGDAVRLVNANLGGRIGADLRSRDDVAEWPKAMVFETEIRSRTTLAS